MNRISCLLASVVLVFVPSIVHAEPTAAEREISAKIAADAKADMDRGAYDRGCPKLEIAWKLVPDDVTTLRLLGVCENEWGKPTSALQRLETARQLAVKQWASDKMTEMDKLIADMNARAPKVRIIVPDTLRSFPAMIIVMDRRPVEAAQWGNTILVDPGIHEITVTAPDKSPWVMNVEAKSGRVVDVEVAPPWGIKIETPAPAPEVRPSHTKIETPAPAPEVRPLPPAASLSTLVRSMSSEELLGYVVAGVGSVGIITGGIFGVMAISNNSDSKDGFCNTMNQCIQQGYDMRKDAQDYANTSTGMIVVGGVVAAGGLLLVVTNRSPKPDTTARTSFWIGPGSFGIRGVW
jgi:hypothetical protein